MTLMKIICCITLLLLTFLNPAAGIELTGQSGISILTLAPGRDLHTVFGHTAIRITDDSLKIDRIYNFGTFDDRSPFFYFKFLRGDINYFLSIAEYDIFFRNTIDEKRTITEQKLDLSYPERRKIFKDLERQYNSSARFYRYDFFYDNCATRVREIIFNVPGVNMVYDTSMFCCKSFRELVRPYVTKNYWLDLGVNLLLGRSADRKARSLDFMFLPDYIRLILNNTSGVEKEQTLLEMPLKKSWKFNFSHLSPWILMTVVLYLYLRTKYRKFVFKAFLAVFSLAGLNLLIISSITLNRILTDNMNIWWTLPSILLLIIKYERMNYFLELLYCSYLILIVFAGCFQLVSFSITFIPWIITMTFLLLTDIRWHRNTVLSAWKI